MCVWCVTVTCVSTVSLSQTQLDLCQGFHQYIFSRVLRLTDTLELLDSQVVCYIVVYCTVLYCTVQAGGWGLGDSVPSEGCGVTTLVDN